MLVVLAQAFNRTCNLQLIVIEGAHGFDSPHQRVEFVPSLCKTSARCEFRSDRLLHEEDLCMTAEFLVAFAQLSEHGAGTCKFAYILVILFRNVLQNECLDGLVIDVPNTIGTGISGFVGGGERALYIYIYININYGQTGD